MYVDTPLRAHGAPVAVALGVALALGYLVLAWRGEAARPTRAIRVIAVIAAATAIAAAPLVLLRIVRDLRTTEGLPRRTAQEIGPSTGGFDRELFNRLESRLPKGAHYYVAVAPPITGSPRDVFVDWSTVSLLPSIRVADPAKAAWLLTWGVRPATLAPHVAIALRLRAAVHPEATVYLARVER